MRKSYVNFSLGQGYFLSAESTRGSLRERPDRGQKIKRKGKKTNEIDKISKNPMTK